MDTMAQVAPTGCFGWFAVLIYDILSQLYGVLGNFLSLNRTNKSCKYEPNEKEGGTLNSIRLLFVVSAVSQ